MSKKSLALGLTLIALLALIAYRSPVTLADNPEPPPPTAEADGPLRYRFAQGAGKTAPLELSAADGTGLKLKLYQAKTVLQGPLAFTELRLTFENPEDRVREGHFRITLPDQAAISRFAMRIDDEWQEAEVVERQAARRAYEDFLHKRQDPALLEKAAGNEFSARVFPIPAKGTKELVLSYSQEVGASRRYYTLPVQGLPRVEDFEIEVQVEREGKRHTVEVKEKDFAPPGDFQLAGLQTEPAISSGPLLVARVSPKLEGGADVPEDLLILLDTSASRALGLESQQDLLNDLVKRLPSVKKLTVAAFDQEVVEIYSGNPAELSWDKQTTRGAYGATDLEKALRWAALRQDHTRLLLVTDGVSTAGSTALNELFQGSGIQRVDTLITGGIRDKARMDLLAESGTQREGMALDAASSVEALARALSGSVTSGLDVSVQDALWTWPTTFNNLQPGEQRLVYAQLPEGYEGTPKLTIGEETIEISPTSYDASPLLERSAAVAQIARWETELAEAKDPEKREELSNQIVRISKEKRVLSDRTALLVLETEADYRRFEIDRNALSDILTIDESGLQLNKRQDIPAPPPMATNRQPRTKQTERLFGDELKNKDDQGIVQSTEVLEEPMPEATVSESRQVRRESINYAYQETAP
ncbi:MAG: hypothetical protein KC800_30840, partial [Candidatus Eremiobacteraeota bacterium]|nr:hypothetical protein [Candidatus Eremiobacteraeota bacterium]